MTPQQQITDTYWALIDRGAVLDLVDGELVVDARHGVLTEATIEALRIGKAEIINTVIVRHLAALEVAGGGVALTPDGLRLIGLPAAQPVISWLVVNEAPTAAYMRQVGVLRSGTLHNIYTNTTATTAA